jgi:hypothetical protein
MKNIFLIIVLILFADCSYAITIHIGAGYPQTTITHAKPIVKPGDTLLCHDAVMTGGQYIDGLSGSGGKYIYIIADPTKNVTIQGGNNSIQFADCNYIHFEGFIIQGQTGNGLNIDDAATPATPTHHWRINKCIFRNINATGNNDLLKLSGLDNFEITNCTFLNGALGGSGVDMVGCHFGMIADNIFENLGSNSIQAKGGTHEIDILRNHFKNGGARALNLGGSTGLEFFRPLNSKTEAERIRVIANVIEGSEAAIAFVGSTQVEVSNNTILYPKKWILRILQETVDPTRFLPCGNNTFFNNIVVVDNNVSIDVNIGPNTLPETFTFENNLWFKTTNLSWLGPVLPGKAVNSKVANPMILTGTVYKIPLFSAATAFGKAYNKNILDKDKRFFNSRPSVGAYESNPLTVRTKEQTTTTIYPYPNPFSEELHLDLDLEGEKQIEVYNINGQRVERLRSTDNTIIIKTSGLSNGSYFIVIRNDTTVLTSRIIERL